MTPVPALPGLPTHLLLASGSPRRLALLSGFGLRPEVAPTAIDETPLPGERPVALVERLAHAKAAATETDAVVLAADTIVELDGEPLGKPADVTAARAMLRRLAGRRHEVHTAVAVRQGGRSHALVATTVVWFRALEAAEIDWYVSTGEPLDKAGGYGIQGSAGAFVTRIEGSFTNVVGLPLPETIELLRRISGS